MPLVQAHITKVEREVDSEWGAIHTDDGVIKKLTTKRQDLLREAANLKSSGVLVGIDYSERVKTVQTEGGPRTYHDYYYNGGGALDNGAGSADAGIDIVQSSRGEDPDRSWRICLQTGGKLAVATLPLMPVDQRDFETQKTIAQAWGEFFFFTPRPERSSGITRPLSSSYSEPNFPDMPPPYTDDDIPY